MAVRHGYGKIAGTDALVFAYDTGDTRNSYKGEPTVNLLPNGVAAGHNSGTYGNVVTVTDATAEKGPGWKKVTISNRGSNSRIIQWTYLSMSANIMYCHSAVFDWGNMRDKGYLLYFDGNGTGTRAYYRPGDYINQGSVNIDSTMPDGKFAGTIIHTASHIHAFFIVNGTTGVSGLNDYFYYKEFQVEINSHPTQYTAGTRSATQGLLDLTGNSTIDLSNVSFNGDAQMTFDGTNDVAYSGNLPQLDTFSIEVVLKPSILSGWFLYRNTNMNYTDNNDNFIFGFSGNKLYGGVEYHPTGDDRSVTSTTVLNTGEYVHGVLVHDNSTLTLKIYVNGNLEGTTVSTGQSYPYRSTNKMSIGADGGSNHGGIAGNKYFYSGDINVVKIYNRALTAAEVQANFKNYRKRFEGLDYYYDNTTDGGRWIRFWWYTGVGWPGHETEAFGHDFGTFDSSSHYGFQKLPAGLTKSQVELLAKDGSGNIYKWDFANASSTAQRVWDSMTAGTKGAWAEGGAFNPTVIAGAFHGVQQDSWQYRISEGVASFLLDDDTCDCYSTLNAGHAMCGGSGWNQTYAQPDGAYLRYGVDTLNDGGCLGPLPTRQLELYYRIKQ